MYEDTVGCYTHDGSDKMDLYEENGFRPLGRRDGSSGSEAIHLVRWVPYTCEMA